jgi:carboxyl-terminal processing protease
MERRRRLGTALLVLVCASSAVAHAEEAFRTRLELAERAYRASRVYATALTYFAHWADAPDAPAIESAYQAYLDAALASDDRVAFTRASMRFLATFHNGHTIFIDFGLSKQSGTLPFTARSVAGRWVVTGSRVPGLRQGDVVETIDGRPFEEFFRELEPLLSASTEPWKRRLLFMQVPGVAPFAHLLPERFVLGLARGQRVSVDRRSMPDVELGQPEARWLEPGTLAYIRVPSFFYRPGAPSQEKRTIDLVRQYKDAAALIVDVRGNGGGSTPEDLYKALMNKPYRWWTESTPASLPFFRVMAAKGSWEYKLFDRSELMWRGATSEPAADAYQGRLAILADGGCFSACEDFVMPFKDNGRAIVVGETTGGSTGQPYVVELGDGMQAIVGSKREMFPDGGRFEGVGIRPDVEVAPTAEDLRAGRDVELEAARARLLASAERPGGR